MTSIQIIFARVRAAIQQLTPTGFSFRARAWYAGLIVRWILGGMLSVGLTLAGGCEMLGHKKPEFTPPLSTMAPYDMSQGEVLWAVVPLANETGTELIDPLLISDKLVAAAEEVEGVRTVPLNRTLVAMRALEISRITDPGQIRKLASAMGVDGVLVGSITAWDPYDPPTLGLSLALYANPGRVADGSLDTRALSKSPTDMAPGAQSGYSSRPASVVSAHLDARDHAVLSKLKDYATGRHDPASALGWHRYTASMDLYTQFAAHELVAELLDKERARIWGMRRVQKTALSSP